MNSASVSVSLAPSSSPSESPSPSAPSRVVSESLATSSEASSFVDRRLASALFQCEQAWEGVFTSTSELSLALVAARTARGFSRTAAHQILGAASKAHSLAGDGQSEVAAIHRLIERFATLNQIEIGYGDGRPKPQYDDMFTGG